MTFACNPDESAGLAEQFSVKVPGREEWAALREPFPHPQKVTKRWKDKQTGEQKSITLDYIGHAVVADRLLSVDPTYTFEPLIDAQGFPIVVTEGLSQGDVVGVWGRLSVLGTQIVEFCSGTNLLDAYSRCLCRCAMRRGVALDLWIKDEDFKAPAGEPSASPRAATPPPVASPAGFPVPTSWKAVQEGMGAYGQSTLDDFNAFGVQAREYLYAGKESNGLDPGERKELLRLTGCAVKFIRDMCSPDTLPPPDRKLMRAAWATFLDGAELEGPPWKMGPDETEREER